MDEPPRDSSGNFDMMKIMEEFLPLEELAKFKHNPVQFAGAPISWGGHNLICDRCGSLVNIKYTDAHQQWHLNLSAAIWMLQSSQLAHMAEHEGIING